MAQVISHWPLTVEARVSSCGICGGQSGTGTGPSPSSSVFQAISFHWSCPYSHTIWEMNRPTGGNSSDIASFHQHEQQQQQQQQQLCTHTHFTQLGVTVHYLVAPPHIHYPWQGTSACLRHTVSQLTEPCTITSSWYWNVTRNKIKLNILFKQLNTFKNTINNNKHKQCLRPRTSTANTGYKILSGDQPRQCSVKNQRFGD
jgi:hypothetical protein